MGDALRFEHWLCVGEHEATRVWLRDLSDARVRVLGAKRVEWRELTWYSAQLFHLTLAVRATPALKATAEIDTFVCDVYETNFVGGEVLGTALMAVAGLLEAAREWPQEGQPLEYRECMEHISAVVWVVAAARDVLKSWKDVNSEARTQLEVSLSTARAAVAALGYWWLSRRHDGEMLPLTATPTAEDHRAHIDARTKHLKSACLLLSQAGTRWPALQVRGSWAAQLRPRSLLAQGQVALLDHTLPTAVVLLKEAARLGMPSDATPQFLARNAQPFVALAVAEASVSYAENVNLERFQEGTAIPARPWQLQVAAGWAPRLL